MRKAEAAVLEQEGRPLASLLVKVFFEGPVEAVLELYRLGWP